MTRTPYLLSDLGERLWWTDFRDFVAHLPPSKESALYRALYPKSWWWEPSMDFMAAILNALQWANWQRGGGKGDKPKPIKRPKDHRVKGPKTAAEVEAKRQNVKDTIRRRRAVRHGN